MKEAYWKKLRSSGPDRHIELALTFVIAAFTATQWYTNFKSSGATTQQTAQLITAAQLSARAARENAEAANSFATSARGINEGVGNAISRLGQQVAATEDARTTAEKSARFTLSATRDAAYIDERPWVALQIVPPQQGVQHTMLIDEEYLVRNTGRTPAIDFHTECREALDSATLEEGPDCDIVARAKRIMESASRQEALRKAGYTPEEIKRDLSDKAVLEESLRKSRFPEYTIISPYETQSIGESGDRWPDDFTYHYSLGHYTYRDVLRPDELHNRRFCLFKRGNEPFRKCYRGQSVD